VSRPRELSKNTYVKQSVVLADTREGQVRVGADVPSIIGKTGYSLWVLQQHKIVGCCPGGRVLTVKRCCAVDPVDLLVAKVASIQTD